MKKMTILTIVLVLAIALTACGSEKAPETTAAATVATTPVETTAPQPLNLANWSMSASTWSSPNGATIHVSATPTVYAEENKADFVVRLEGDEISNVPCEWDGSAYTASADLNAANGYCYYMVLTSADGTAVEVALNTPSEPLNTAYIDMAAALESYCSVTLEESSFDKGKLTLTNGKALVKVPTIAGEDAPVSCQEANLVLTHNGQELTKQALTLEETEIEGLYECDITGVVFEIPEMDKDQEVALTLAVTLTNGTSLSAYGGNWIFSADTLLPAVG